jgi:hypothetical protein
MFADEIIRARRAKSHVRKSRQRGEVVVKFFWWPLIISIGLSILLTIILNVVF